MTRPRRLPRVRPAEVPRLVAALVAALAVELGLRTTTLPRLARLLGTPLGGPDTFAGPAEARLLPDWALLRVDAARRVLRRWPFGDTCLRQALVCGWLVRGLRPQLQLGVARVEGEVRAHAWLVVDGAVVDPRRAVSSYQPLVPARAGATR